MKVEREKREGPGKDPLPKGESHQNNWNRKRKVRGAEDGSVHEIVALSANYGEAVLKLRLFGPSLFIH